MPKKHAKKVKEVKSALKQAYRQAKKGLTRTALKRSVNRTVRTLSAKKPTILKHIVKAKDVTFKAKHHKRTTLKPLMLKSKRAVKVRNLTRKSKSKTKIVKVKNYWKLAMKYAKKVTKNLKIANADHESDSPTVKMDILMSKGMVSAVKDGHRED